MSYSLQLYTLRNAIQEDLPGTIRKVAEIGFTQVEPYNFVATAKELGAALKENGLTAPPARPAAQPGPGRNLRRCQGTGHQHRHRPYLPAEHWQNAEDIQATAAKLNAAAKKGAEYGIRVGYHNHAWELESSIEGRTALEYFAGLLDPELVLEVDTYWVAVGGQDPVDMLTKLGDRVKFIHIKDGPLNTDTKAQQPAGQGKIAVWDVIGAAKSLEVGVVEFDDYSGDIFEGIAQVSAFLNSAAKATKGRRHERHLHAARGPVGVGVIGAGNISKQYLDNLTAFPDLKVHVIGDLFEDAAEARAKEYGVAEWGGVDAALNHPDVEIIVNLTIPAAHVEVATAAVNAGKHVWTEKPSRWTANPAWDCSKRPTPPGCASACAPDTFLGAGLQTARRLIERGDIGTPLTAMTTFQTPGPESWHPNPAFLFQYGAGPLFDMGPYYLTALVQTFGRCAGWRPSGRRPRRSA